MQEIETDILHWMMADMKIELSFEDICFACAVRLDIPLDAVTGIDFESATFEGVEVNIIFVDIKDAEKMVCTGICFPVDIPHARWAYDLLVHYGVWRKSEQTHH